MGVVAFALEEVHSATVNHRDQVPLLLRARSCTRTAVPTGVAAFQDGISWVAPKPVVWTGPFQAARCMLRLRRVIGSV